MLPGRINSFITSTYVIKEVEGKMKGHRPASGRCPVMSGWQDSNLRPPAPKAGALTGLRYTPFSWFIYHSF